MISTYHDKLCLPKPSEVPEPSRNDLCARPMVTHFIDIRLSLMMTVKLVIGLSMPLTAIEWASPSLAGGVDIESVVAVLVSVGRTPTAVLLLLNCKVGLE